MAQEISNDLSQKYNKWTIAIHWLTAFLIMILFPLGKYMAGLDPYEKMGWIRAHVLLGIFVFVLTIIRSWYFFKSPRPTSIKTGSKLNDRLAIWIHNAFYFLLFGLTISGIATMVIGGYGDALTIGNSELIQARIGILPLKGHGALAMIMMLLLVMHIIGVVKHYFLLKENALKRMS